MNVPQVLCADVCVDLQCMEVQIKSRLLHLRKKSGGKKVLNYKWDFTESIMIRLLLLTYIKHCLAYYMRFSEQIWLKSYIQVQKAEV